MASRFGCSRAHMITKLLFSLAILVPTFGQISNNTITVIPKTDLSATGELRFRDRQTASHHVGFLAPDSIATDVVWRLPNADNAGCLQSDGSAHLSLGPCAN